MNRAIRRALVDYSIRIVCFGWTLYFTFASPFWPAALAGWMSVAVLFVLDFL
ncbi:MAG TPA: hypothetical protein VIH59_02105 [Candidatus Tectomicrobia bacterium]